VTSGARSDAAIAGIAASGLIVTYTEHAPTFVFGGVVAWILLLSGSRNKTQFFRLTASRVSLAIAVAVILSPLGFLRAVRYSEVLAAGSSTGSPPQAGVSLSTLPVLLTGTLHLHELDEVASMGVLETVGIYDITFAILGLVFLAAATTSGGPRNQLVLPAASVIAVSGVLYSYFQLKGGCGDCVYKSVTLAPVFLAVAIASAVQLLWASRGGSTVVRLFTAAVIVAYGGLLLRGQAALVRGADRVEAATAFDSYAIPQAIQDLPDGPVLVEGAASTADFEPFFHGPEILYLAGRSSRHPLRYESTTRDLVTGFGLPQEPFASDYRYIATAFPGLETDRERVESFGEYAVDRRASGDVAVLQSSGTRDPSYRGVAAIPWLRGPITLRVSGIATGARLVLRFTGGVVPSTSFAVLDLAVQQRSSRRPGNKLVCVTLPPSERPTDVTIVPGEFSSPPVPRDEVDGPVPVPKGIGLAAWSLRPVASECTE
jgi:hypothetical protein